MEPVLNPDKGGELGMGTDNPIKISWLRNLNQSLGWRWRIEEVKA